MKYYDYPKRELHGWHPVTIPYDCPFRWDVALKWCEEYESNSEFCLSYAPRVWWFRKEKDAILFSLRWS